MKRMSCARDKALEKVSSLVTSIDHKKIKVVAVDFDQTLISIHSGGVWKDSIENLIKHLRPCMRDLLGEALQKDLIVCIVTFHSQPWVIREMMRKILPKNGEKIIVQANTVEFREKHNYEFLGKEAHIAAVLTEVYNRRKQIIKPEEVILFDDDSDNITTAIKFGHWAIQVKEDVSYDSFSEFIAYLESKKKP